LGDLILESGHPDRPLSSVILLPPPAFNRRRFVAPGAEPLVEVTEIFIEVLALLLCRYPIHSRNPAFAGAVKGFFEKVDINQVCQGREHPPRFADCLLCNSLEFR
jgi:hypothetical protein